MFPCIIVSASIIVQSVRPRSRMLGSTFFTARKWSLGQGKVFIGVCHSFCPRGRVGLITCITGQMTSWVCIQRGWSAWGSGLHPGAEADPGFPRGGAPTPWGRQHTILPKFPKNCMKLKEFVPCDPTHLVPPLRWGWTEPPPPPETRSTSRWYASYWNAFTFLQYFSRFIFSYFMNKGNSSENFSTVCTLGCFLLPIALSYLKFHLEILLCIWMNFLHLEKS